MDANSVLMAVLSACTSGLAGTVWYVIRQNNAKIEAERVERERLHGEERAERTRLIEVERQARIEEMKAERAARDGAMERYTELFLKAYREERDARDQMHRRIEDGRSTDRHDLRDEMALIAAKQAAHELYCAREYVSYPRLTEALRPIVEGQQRIFERLDGKADKKPANT
jgi:hypothetical protein